MKNSEISEGHSFLKDYLYTKYKAENNPLKDKCFDLAQNIMFNGNSVMDNFEIELESYFEDLIDLTHPIEELSTQNEYLKYQNHIFYIRCYKKQYYDFTPNNKVYNNQNKYQEDVNDIRDRVYFICKYQLKYLKQLDETVFHGSEISYECKQIMSEFKNERIHQNT